MPVNFRSDLTLILLLQLWALSGRVKLVDSANDKRSFISAYVMNRSVVIVGGSASPRRNDSAPFGVRLFHSTTFTTSAEWGVKPLTASAPTNPINLLLGAAKNPQSVVLSI